MINQSIDLVLYVEIFRTIIGFFLVGLEINGMRDNLRSKTTLSLFGTVFFLNILFLLRFLGIQLGQTSLRQFGTAVSGLIAAFFLISWASIIIGLSNQQIRISQLIMVLGVIGFGIGRIYHFNTLEMLSVALLCITIGSLIYSIFRFVFNKTPYVKAKQRIFIITMAWTIFIIFEGLAIFMLGQEKYAFTAIFLGLALLGRGLMTLGILLPLRLQNTLLRVVR